MSSISKIRFLTTLDCIKTDDTPLTRPPLSYPGIIFPTESDKIVTTATRRQCKAYISRSTVLNDYLTYTSHSLSVLGSHGVPLNQDLVIYLYPTTIICPY